MNRIAQFEKVSFEQFLKDYNDTFDYRQSTEEIKIIWNSIKLPTRATIGSAGYDFVTPIDLALKPRETIKIPTVAERKQKQTSSILWKICKGNQKVIKSNQNICSIER